MHSRKLSVALIYSALLCAATAAQAGSYSYMHSQCMSKFNGTQCTKVGLYHIRKRGEVDKGIMYLQRACKLDNIRGCTILGNIYKYGKYVCTDPFMAKRYYDKACRLGSDAACELYNNYRPRVVYTNALDELLKGFTYKGETKKHCKCKQTIPEKEELPCPSLKDPI